MLRTIEFFSRGKEWTLDYYIISGNPFRNDPLLKTKSVQCQCNAAYSDPVPYLSFCRYWLPLALQKWLKVGGCQKSTRNYLLCMLICQPVIIVRIIKCCGFIYWQKYYSKMTSTSAVWATISRIIKLCNCLLIYTEWTVPWILIKTLLFTLKFTNVMNMDVIDCKKSN